MSSARPEPQTGDIFAGKFRIERLLGKGGMGAVYAAQHEGLKQKFAIKVLLGEIADNPEAVARFMNEASSAAVIQTEHVARVTDVSKTDDGLPYMVMEYLEGGDLSQVLEERGRLEPSEAVDYVLQALEAVHQAHEAKIVHRDLKPSNLFLARKADGSSIVKVLDFGISKVQGEQSGALTSTRSMLGSPLYMSPEQLRSSKAVDSRSDIWSIGIILYELLTGTVPYNGEGLGELFAAILEQDPTPLREKNPEVSPELEAVVMGCLRKKREERYQSVADLAGALGPFAPPGRMGGLATKMLQGAMVPAPVFGLTGAAIVSPASSSGPFPVQSYLARPLMPSYARVTGSQPSWANTAAPDIGLTPVVKTPVGLFVGLGVAVIVLVAVGVGGIAFYKSRGTDGAGVSAGTSLAVEPAAVATATATALSSANSVPLLPTASAQVPAIATAPIIAATASAWAAKAIHFVPDVVPNARTTPATPATPATPEIAKPAVTFGGRND